MPSATLKPSTKVENVAAVPTPLAAPACVVPLPPASVVMLPSTQRGDAAALGETDDVGDHDGDCVVDEVENTDIERVSTIEVVTDNVVLTATARDSEVEALLLLDATSCDVVVAYVATADDD